MPDFYIKLNDVRREESDFQNIIEQLYNAAEQIGGVKDSHVLQDSVCFTQVRTKLKNSHNEMMSLRYKIGQMRSTLLEIVDIYERTENGILGQKVEIQANIDINIVDNRDENPNLLEPTNFLEWLRKVYQDFFGEKEDEKTVWDVIKKYLTYQDKFEKNPYAGVEKSVVSYLESLIGFFSGDKRGGTGAKDFCDLTNASSGLWSSLYSFFKKFDVTKTDSDIGEFAKKWGNVNGCVETIGSSSNLIGALIEAFQTEGKSEGEFWADIVNTGGKFADVIKSFYEWKNFDVVKEGGGIISAAGKYTILTDTTCSVISQTIKSVEEYSKDGTFDLGDFGATGVDLSVAGLYTMGSGLVSGLTFGLVSLDSIGLEAEKISDFIKESANSYGYELGKKARDYMNARPELDNAYQIAYENGDKIKMNIIANYAKIKSLF